MNSASELVKRLHLQPHPEGGWYREVHRSNVSVETARGTRSALTNIYYLLERHQLSRWHVVESDETWHFYGGAPLELITYEPPAGPAIHNVLCGPQTSDGQPLGVVAAGTW